MKKEISRLQIINELTGCDIYIYIDRTKMFEKITYIDRIYFTSFGAVVGSQEQLVYLDDAAIATLIESNGDERTTYNIDGHKYAITGNPCGIWQAINLRLCASCPVSSFTLPLSDIFTAQFTLLRAQEAERVEVRMFENEQLEAQDIFSHNDDAINYVFDYIAQRTGEMKGKKLFEKLTTKQKEKKQ